MSSLRLQLARPVARLLGVAALMLPLTGCQSIATSNTQIAQLRIIDASPDAPGIDILQNGSPLIYNIGFGYVSSYVPVTPANYTITADTTGTKQVLAKTTATVSASQQYTVLIGNTAANLQEQVLTDRSVPAPAGTVSIRFIDQATRVGAVDIYLVPTGQKLTAVNAIATNVVFSTNTGYLNVPTSDYSIVLLPAGTVTTSTTTASYTGATITYPAGCARTVVLLDQIILNNPGFNVIEADDYDSPTAAS